MSAFNYSIFADVYSVNVSTLGQAEKWLDRGGNRIVRDYFIPREHII